VVHKNEVVVFRLYHFNRFPSAQGFVGKNIMGREKGQGNGEVEGVIVNYEYADISNRAYLSLNTWHFINPALY
jgi:hypothetical protein